MKKLKSKETTDVYDLNKNSYRNAARTVRSIRRQNAVEGDHDEMTHLALKHSEEAAFVLACKCAGDNDAKLHRILRSQNLEELL